VGHRFNSDNPVAFGGFALIETFGLFVKTNREVGRFNKGPGQVLITVFGVALAFLVTAA
jgi:hypothetical protein